MIMLKYINTRLGVAFLLLVSTIFDCLTTYATAGHKLYLDGNPLFWKFNWTQLIIFQASAYIVIVIIYCGTFKKQHLLWPLSETKFIGFLQYSLTKGCSLKLDWGNLKTEIVYIGNLVLWFILFAHLLAGIIMLSALLGGPSFIDLLKPFGIRNIRTMQFMTCSFIFITAWIVAHYPLYLAYLNSRHGKVVDGKK